MTKATAKIEGVNLYIGTGAINKATDSLAKTLHARQAEAHKLALSVLYHVGMHKDVNVVKRFVTALPEMIRTNGLRNWFEQFGPVQFVTTEDGTEIVKYVKDKPTRFGDANAKPFWKFSAKEGQPYQPVDVEKFFDQMLKRLEKDAKETGVDHSARLAALRFAKAGLEVQPVTAH